MRTGRPDARWPTPLQAELVRAVALDGPQAAQAWARWRAACTLEEHDEPSFRLLPRLWSNAGAAGVAADERVVLAGVYRRALWLNHRALDAARTADEALRAAGIETAVLKGAARLAGRPERIGARQLGDVDLLVRRPDAGAALAVLIAHGWRTRYAGRRRAIGVQHAVDLVRDDGTALDLHWSAMETPGDDGPLWARTVLAEVAGRPVRVPVATDQLLVTCAHGMGPHPAALHWIPDALDLTAGSDGDVIDWALLEREAVRRGVAWQVADALDGLAERFGAGVPAATRSRLRTAPATLAARAAHRAVSRPPPFGGSYVVEWHRYRRLAAIADPDRGRTFAEHLARRWGFPAAGALPPAAARRAARFARTGRLDPWDAFAPRDPAMTEAPGGGVPHAGDREAPMGSRSG